MIALKGEEGRRFHIIFFAEWRDAWGRGREPSTSRFRYTCKTSKASPAPPPPAPPPPVPVEFANLDWKGTGYAEAVLGVDLQYLIPKAFESLVTGFVQLDFDVSATGSQFTMDKLNVAVQMKMILNTGGFNVSAIGASLCLLVCVCVFLNTLHHR